VAGWLHYQYLFTTVSAVVLVRHCRWQLFATLSKAVSIFFFLADLMYSLYHILVFYRGGILLFCDLFTAMQSINDLLDDFCAAFDHYSRLL